MTTPAQAPADLSDDLRTHSFDLGRGHPCLLLHGFTGTPYEMRPLGESLARQGYRAVGPCLAGHASTEAAFAAASADAWYDGVRAALLSLAQEHPGKPVHLLGLSMGAMLAIRLAAEHPGRVGTLTLLAPAAQFRGAIRLFFRIFRYDVVARRWPSWPKEGVGLDDREMAERAPRMHAIPTASAREVVRTLQAGWAAAPRVNVPSIVVYGGHDRTVSNDGVRALAARLRPRPTQVVRLGRSAHVLPLDREREELAALVSAFLRGRDDLRG